jgi:ParB-like chromosome segregation protein Spo0J
MKMERISLDEIDLHDHRFRFSYYFDLDNLLFSIEKIGLVYPLVVVKREEPRYVLLSGWKRIAVCLELSLLHPPVFVLDEKDDFRAFLISFYENLTTRRFTLLEKAEILRLLSGFIEDENRIVKSFLPLLEIPATLSYLDVYLKIARLSPRWKEMIFQKKIPFSSVEFLLEFTPDERKELFPLLEPLNINKQKQILEDLHELSHRAQEPLQKILSGPEIQSFLKHKKLSSLQKAEKVRSLVKKKRYPMLSAWYESFRASLKKARLLSDVTYDSSALFEDGEFSVTFDLNNKNSFQNKIAKLQELISDKDLFRLFKNFYDE